MEEEMERWREMMRFANEHPDLPEQPPLSSFQTQSCLGSSPLHFAALSDNLEMASLLLDHNVDPNASNYYGETPLHWACHKGHTQMILPLLASGADINQADHDGETPLHWCVREENWKAIQLLLLLGASSKLENSDSMTPLQLARDQQAWRCILLLHLRECRAINSMLVGHKRSSSQPASPSPLPTQTPP